MCKNWIKCFFEMLFHNIFHYIEQPCSVTVFHQTVVEDTKYLMYKQTNHCLFAFNRTPLNEQAAMDNTWEVTQVERIMRLGWCGQEIFDGFLIHLKTINKQSTIWLYGYITISFKRSSKIIFFQGKQLTTLRNANNVWRSQSLVSISGSSHIHILLVKISKWCK